MGEHEWLPGSVLRDLIHGPDWFPDGQPGRVFVRYYVPVLIEIDDVQPGEAFEGLVLAGAPVRVGVVELKDQKYTSHHYQWTSTASGSQILQVEAVERELAQSLYVILSTPVQEGRDEIDASKRLDRFVTLLRYALGKNFTYQLAREAVVHLPRGNMTQASPLIRTPQPPDGPTFGDSRRKLLREVLDALGNADEETASRCLFALELFERAATQREGIKFFYYWIGVEVACATHGMQAVLARLVAAYDDDRSYIQNDLGFQRIWDLRTDLVHRAREHQMPQDVEAYVRAMCMDLLRFELGLPCRRHMEEHIRAGFDLERLDREVGTRSIASIRVKGPE